jgi:hypothetical protein
VLTAGIPVRNGHVVIALPAGAQSVSWSSKLEIAQRIPLVAPGTPWVELWRLSVSPLWHIETKGTPEVFPKEWQRGCLGASVRTAAWQSLSSRSRDRRASKARRSRSSGSISIAVGRRATDVTLQLDCRSTQGGRHVIKLPTDARLQSVQSDGQPLTLDLRDGELALPLQPGAHSLQIAWQVGRGARLATRPDMVDLQAPASNVATHIGLPEDCWMLFRAAAASGPPSSTGPSSSCSS